MFDKKTNINEIKTTILNLIQFTGMVSLNSRIIYISEIQLKEVKPSDEDFPNLKKENNTKYKVFEILGFFFYLGKNRKKNIKNLNDPKFEGKILLKDNGNIQWKVDSFNLRYEEKSIYTLFHFCPGFYKPMWMNKKRVEELEKFLSKI